VIMSAVDGCWLRDRLAGGGEAVKVKAHHGTHVGQAVFVASSVRRTRRSVIERKAFTFEMLFGEPCSWPYWPGSIETRTVYPNRRCG